MPYRSIPLTEPTAILRAHLEEYVSHGYLIIMETDTTARVGLRKPGDLYRQMADWHASVLDLGCLGEVGACLMAPFMIAAAFLRMAALKISRG